MPVTWIAKEGELVTEILDTTESTRMDVFVQFTNTLLDYASLKWSASLTKSNCVDLALDLNCCSFATEQVNRLVDLSIFHNETRLILEIFLQERSVSACENLEPVPTIIHFVPSRAIFDGFLPAKAAGLDGRIGFLDTGDVALVGTVLDARNSGFL